MCETLILGFASSFQFDCCNSKHLVSPPPNINNWLLSQDLKCFLYELPPKENTHLDKAFKFNNVSHLHPQVIQDCMVLAVVACFWSTFLQGLSDLHLQFAVLLLQPAHRFQVSGQTVVQILHVAFLIAMMNPVEAVPARDPAAPEPMPAELTLKAVEEEMPPLLGSRTERHGRGGWDPGALSTCPAIRTSGTVYRYRAVKGDVRGLRCVEAHGGGGRKYWVHKKMSVCWGTSAVESYRKRTMRLLYPTNSFCSSFSLSDSQTHTHTDQQRPCPHGPFFP